MEINSVGIFAIYILVRLPSQGLDQAVILSNAFVIDTVQQQENYVLIFLDLFAN